MIQQIGETKIIKTIQDQIIQRSSPKLIQNIQEDSQVTKSSLDTFDPSISKTEGL